MEAREFVPVRVGTLRGDSKITFDVYVRVASKYICYCRKGDSFEGSRLQKFKEKKIKQLFIETNHENAYREYMTRNIEQAYDKNSGKSIENRSEIIQGSQQSNAEEVMENPEDRVAYDLAKIGSEKYVNFIMEEKEAVKAIMAIQNTDNNIAHHGVTVSTIGLAMAQKQGLEKEYPLEQFTMGCLLHDIEHTHSGIDVGRPITEFSNDELKKYRQHPSDGIARIEKYKHFDAGVLDIILNHEETIDGSGFPNGKREKDLSPLAQIAATANAYDRFVTFEGYKDSKEALKKLLVDKMGLYSLKNLQSLQDVLKSRGIV